MKAIHISFLFLYNKLPQAKWPKTTSIYYFTVSVGQKSGQGQAGLSAQGLRAKSRCQRCPIWSLGSPPGLTSLLVGFSYFWL